MKLEVLKNEDPNSIRDRVGKVGVERIMKVNYINDLPPNAMKII